MKDWEEMPTPCPRCGDIVDHSEMIPARLAKCDLIRRGLSASLICRKCASIKNTNILKLRRNR